jgi:5-enolpyruvylshikimate-3-phosphate synthase
VGRSFAPAQEDAVLVQILKKMGAIVIAKTNIPQSIMVRPRSSLAVSGSEIDSSSSGPKLRILSGD